MANMMKKTLAMVLALSLLASQLALPAMAADSQESQPSGQITVTNSSEITTVDPATGAETTVNTLEGTTADGAAVKQETTTTVTYDEQNNNPMQFEQKTEWTQDTEVTQPTGEVEQTNTTGSEVLEGDVITNPDLSQTYTREATGSETTTEDSTKTEQVDQHETVLDPSFETGGDADYNESDLPPSGEDVNDNPDWTIGETDVNENGWTQGAVTEGEWVDGSSSSKDGEIVIDDPKLNSGKADDVTIGGLTPGGAEVEVSKPVTLENVVAGLYPELFQLNQGETAVPITENGKVVGYSVTTKNGNVTTVKEIREISGGFEVTTTSTTDPGKDSTKDNDAYKNEDITLSAPTYTNQNGENGEKSSVKIDEFENKLTQGTTSGTEAEGNRTSVVTSTGTADIVTPKGEANGVKTETTTTVKEVTDANGNKGYNETTTIKYENVVTVEKDVPLTDAGTPIPSYQDQVTVNHRYDQPAQANDVLALAVQNRDNGDGTFTTITVKEVLESNGTSSIKDVAGYEVIETKTDADGKVISTAAKTHSNVVPPVVLDRDNGDGTFTNVSLVEIKATQDTPFYKAGDVIGWTAVSVLTDENGKVLETKERDVFGTEVTLTTTVTTNADDLTKTTTYERTDTYITNAFASHYERNASLTATQKRTYVISELEEIAKYLQADNNPENLTFIYKGQMLGVKVVPGSNHGTENKFDVSTVDMGKYDHDDGIQGTDYKNYNGGGFHNYSGMYTDPDNLNPDKWTLNGKGLLSIYQIQGGPNATGTGIQEGKMFRVVKDGEERFVYCVEFGQSANQGYDYDEYVYGDVTESNGSYFKSEVVDAYLCSTALNGFWGNASGIGSLDAVKDFLRRMGKDDAAENITAGEAVTATQAVMWHFTATGESNDFYSGQFVTFINSIDGNAIRSDGSNRTQANIDKVTNDARVQRIYDLFDALVSAAKKDQADGKAGAAQAINAENIVAGAIDVKESMGNNRYKTDLNVKLDVSQSSINDNLVLTVKTENGDYKFRLSGTCAADETFVTMDENGNIVLPNVVLNNDETITVELTGQQTLDKGVYIYKASDSQDFIGLSTKLHNVALQFGYKLGLIDPKLDYETETTQRSKTNTVTYTTDASRKDTRDTLQVTHDAYKTDRSTYVSQLNGIVTETLKTDKRTLENVRWNYYYEFLLTVVNDEDGGDETTILEEEVPLAAAPKTGDASLVFAAMSALSMAGATILKKEEQ